MPKSSQSAVPVIQTARLDRLVPYYRDALGFRLAQHIPGVVAMFTIGEAQLQLWQRNDCDERSFCVVKLGREVDVARLHAMLTRSAPEALMEARPTLQDWGSWEFGLVDPEGHQLVFEQWVPGEATPTAFTAARVRARRDWD
ncbi:MAG: hypothetical protein EOO24_54295 [Comamonadaceae bacterium]|nr:MAG: hypothetical protein EOO24_54295 [Comamonadaceae bacterium]